VTAALFDARTKRVWLFHPGLRQYTAIIVKVQILGTALQQGQTSGQGVPAAEKALIPAMIENSDNDAATTLLRDVGGPSALAKFDQSAGLTQTTPSTLEFIPGTTLPGWGLTKTTALDQVRLVARFAYPSSILSAASRQYGLSLMEHVEADQRWGVTGGVPPDTLVALKNGWLPLGSSGWQIDSIGWIAGHGRNYVLAVLAAGNPSYDYGISTIETISSFIYRAEGRARR
jgi:beta-lactamase class A